MRLTSLLILALRSLSRNKLRSFLTMLGIIIGVGAVIAMLSVGQGAKDMVKTSIAGLGTNVINVFAGGGGPGSVRTEAGTSSKLTEEDVEAIGREAEAIRYITPTARSSAQIKYAGQNWRTSVYGAYPDYLLIRNWGLTAGAPYSTSDERGAAKVALIGQTVAKNLFGEGVDPIGQTIRIKNLPFKVVGVLESKGQGSFGNDQDDIVIAPFSTVQKKLIGATFAQTLIASAVSEESIPDASAQIDDILRRRFRLGPGDIPEYMIRTQTEIAQAAGSVSQTMTVLLSSIAGISLLVGGIGIMNIMLVSVTERTREIGIRLAVGAKGRDILLQFLVEAVVISFCGGLIGIAIGAGASTFLGSVQGWAVRVSPASIIVAFAFSAATGIFFGWYPARKAARLNPIDALRYE
ncbi:MAG: FtsX-like permease family protein [Fibrobacteres bacterium]|nr:FtsX-like permease family protein [Fibrobacterota bacterium]